MVDRLSVPTSEGKDLILTDVLMGVIDIPTIGGIFGMNILASGQLPELLGGDGTPGYFDSVELDFRNATSATMTLNVNAMYDITRQTLNWAGTAGNADWVTAAPTSGCC